MIIGSVQSAGYNMKYCTNCGKQIYSNVAVCPYCGTQQIQSPPLQPYLSPQPNPYVQKLPNIYRQEKGKKHMLYGFLWFIFGMIITLVTYYSASSVYLIMWGAILIGIIEMIYGFILYISS